MSVSFQETAADVLFRKVVVAEATWRLTEAVGRGENDRQAADRAMAYMESKFPGIQPDIAGDLRVLFMDIAKKVREDRPIPVNAGAPL